MTGSPNRRGPESMDDFRRGDDGPAVPKIIWMLWLQGWDDVSPMVRACRLSWQRHNADWDIRAIDRQDVINLVGPTPVPDRFPAALSDVVRARLLSKFGGVWVDATTFCMTPLDGWIREAAAAGFFAFDSPGYGRMLSTWFLAAPPCADVTNKWAEAADRYWADRDAPGEYFWFHRIFAELYDLDETIRRTWDAVPRVSADGPHYFSPYKRNFTGPLTRRASARLAQVQDPMYKLSNRVDVTRASPDSAYAYFVDGARRGLTPSAPWGLVDREAMCVRSWAKRTINCARTLKEHLRLAD